MYIYSVDHRNPHAVWFMTYHQLPRALWACLTLGVAIYCTEVLEA